MPLNIVLAVFSLSFVLKKWKGKLRFLGFLLIFVYTNGFIGNWVISIWESPRKTYQDLKYYEVGIVLTGITNTYQLPKDRIHFSKGFDRLYHAIELYRLGKIKKILITGGNGSLTDTIRESHSLYKACSLFGIPDSALIIEDSARNTYENAHYSKRILDSLKISTKSLIITSAFHMPRALKCFQKQKVNFDTFPTDYYSRPLTFSLPQLLIPQHASLTLWAILHKEWIGLLSYRLMGYV